jgi:hypothetical protein
MMGRSRVGAAATKARVQVKKTTAAFAKYIMKNYLILTSSRRRIGVEWASNGRRISREKTLGSARESARRWGRWIVKEVVRNGEEEEEEEEGGERDQRRRVVKAEGVASLTIYSCRVDGTGRWLLYPPARWHGLAAMLPSPA